MEYRKFYLTPGQQSPEGNTGQGMSDRSIVWVGKEGTFPKVATTDPNEPGVSKIYISHVMSEKELEEYNLLLKYQEEVKDKKSERKIKTR